MVKLEIIKFSNIRNHFSFTFIFFRCRFLSSFVLSFLFLADYRCVSSSRHITLRYILLSSSVGLTSLSLTHLFQRKHTWCTLRAYTSKWRRRRTIRPRTRNDSELEGSTHSDECIDIGRLLHGRTAPATIERVKTAEEMMSFESLMVSSSITLTTLDALFSRFLSFWRNANASTIDEWRWALMHAQCSCGRHSSGSNLLPRSKWLCLSFTFYFPSIATDTLVELVVDCILQ